MADEDRKAPERWQGMAREDKIALIVIGAVLGGLFVAAALAVRWVGATVFGIFVGAGAGMGFGSAFIAALVIAFAFMIVFALVAGDGMIGELPTMLVGFFIMVAFFTATLAIMF